MYRSTPEVPDGGMCHSAYGAKPNDALKYRVEALVVNRTAIPVENKLSVHTVGSTTPSAADGSRENVFGVSLNALPCTLKDVNNRHATDAVSLAVGSAGGSKWTCAGTA